MLTPTLPQDIEARTEAEAAARLAAAEAAQRSKAEGSEEEGAAAGPSGKAGAKGKGGKGGAKAGAAAKGKGTKRGRGGKAKEAEEEEEEPAEAEAEASEGERGSKAPRLALNPTQQLLPLMNVSFQDFSRAHQQAWHARDHQAHAASRSCVTHTCPLPLPCAG